MSKPGGFGRARIKFAGTKATVYRTTIKANAATLIATTCKSCGRVKVYYGSKLVKTISMRSSTTRNKQNFTLPNPSKTTKITFRAADSKVVRIEALLVRNSWTPLR